MCVKALTEIHFGWITVTVLQLNKTAKIAFDALNYIFTMAIKYNWIIVLLRDAFHIGLVIGPRPAVLARGAAEGQYIRPRTYS
jgi:hypothetical protein